MILVLVVNIGFIVFFMLVVLMFKDKYMLCMFIVCGDCFGYLNLIIILGVLVIILIILFEGMIENFILLYVVGVFILFMFV